MRKSLPLFALILALSAARAEEPSALQQPKGGGRVSKMTLTPNWVGESRFWYRNDLDGGKKEFILVDAEKGTRGPAFDHTKLAAALAKTSGAEVAATRLPFDDIAFDGDAVKFSAREREWKCDLDKYECTDIGPAKKPATPPAKKKFGKGGGVEEPNPPAPFPEREGGERRSWSMCDSNPRVVFPRFRG